MSSPPPEILDNYLALLKYAILSLRMRIRYGEQVSLDEVHDFLDALHNIPSMLRNYSGADPEEFVQDDLARYDKRWVEVPASEFRKSLVSLLQRARAGEYS